MLEVNALLLLIFASSIACIKEYSSNVALQIAPFLATIVRGYDASHHP